MSTQAQLARNGQPTHADPDPDSPESHVGSRILSAILADDGAIDRVANVVGPEMFPDARDREIYRAALEVWRAGEPGILYPKCG